jgi:transcriptional regulator with XRE-family HTH domain
MDVRTAQKTEFADRLKAAIDRKGWSMSETARRASDFLNDGEKFGRAHVWHYVQGRALPRFRYLEALSLALDLRPDDLMPGEGDGGQERPAPKARSSGPAAAGKGDRAPASEKAAQAATGSAAGMVHVRDYGDGTALLEISERVPWATALAVLQILKKSPS